MNKESLPCKLTETETIERGDSLAGTVRALEKLDDEKRAFGERHKRALAAAQLEQSRLTTIIESGTEYRLIDVREEPDYKRGLVEMFRDDTGEKLRDREMTEVERQSPLFKEHAPKKPRHLEPAGA